MSKFASLVLFVAASLLFAGCNRSEEHNASTSETATAVPQVAPVLTAEDARDFHSYAQPHIARVSHVALDLTVDFAAHNVAGYATLNIEKPLHAGKRDRDEVVLDSKGLKIEAVTNAESQPLPWRLGREDAILGAPLVITLNGARQVRIHYKSAPDAAALQWLKPEQTAGKKSPFLFSQGEAILNRTWIPTQDSPGIRQTWEARIVVPKDFRAVMSGEDLTPNGEAVPGNDSVRAYHFRMDKPVAPYLIAIAVGDIRFQSLGPRSGVYAEPVMLKAAALELVDTEKMIAAAEKLYGPYRWGRYDMIVLPPSFPFGGMENPRLTFLTPTMIVGDRSLVALIAHELAHSWSGNLVTNATWSDAWLNEGFTNYFENRIVEALYGRPRAVMDQAASWESLVKEVDELEGGKQSPLSKLHMELKGKDPDLGLSGIAYTKGEAMLYLIEQVIGRDRWDAYLRSYFDRHAFQPMTASLFLADLRANLIKGDKELEQKLMLDQWVYQPGIPSNAVVPQAPEFAKVEAAARRFADGAVPDGIGFGQWGTAERIRFLDALPRKLPASRLAVLDQAYGLSGIKNSEVLFAWLQLALTNRYEPAVPVAERFLAEMGRRKFVKPLFKTLVAQKEWGQPIARRIYAKTRPTYHSVTVKAVDEIMEKDAQD